VRRAYDRGALEEVDSRPVVLPAGRGDVRGRGDLMKSIAPAMRQRAYACAPPSASSTSWYPDSATPYMPTRALPTEAAIAWFAWFTPRGRPNVFATLRLYTATSGASMRSVPERSFEPAIVASRLSVMVTVFSSHEDVVFPARVMLTCSAYVPG
jgi:hypothetical protein